MKIAIGTAFTFLFLAFLGLVYWLGAFSTSFNTNVCYSEVLRKITDEVKAAKSSEGTADLESLIRSLEDIPLNGYESNCEDIKRAVENL